jgi:two-component system nitrogen regulation sensor histidine kinase NtrY
MFILDILRKKYDFNRIFAFILVFFSVVLGGATYFSISSQSDLNESNIYRFSFVYINLIFIIIVFIAVFRKWFFINFIQKRKKIGAFRLQKQILILFSLVSLFPAIFVAIFASLFFNLGVQAWFGQPVKDALFESNEVIQAYLREHERNSAFEAQKISNYLAPKLDLLKNDREAFDIELTNLEETFFFTESLVLTKKNQILGKSYLTFALELGSIDPLDFKKAKTNGFVTHIDQDQLRVLVLLDPIDDIYLYIGKPIDKKILDHLYRNQKALNLYNNLEQKKTGFEITFLIVFSVITLLLLFVAILVGLNIANRIVNPISELINAAQNIRDGNWDVQVNKQHFNNELDTLVESFNSMTGQLKKQKTDLILTQRKATWSDIARKIAHEIKNPLTPIQLSAERLKRKYLKEIQNDSVIFEQCINTIIRQVGHIEKLVSEFSNFARMPEAIMDTCDLIELLDENILFIENTNSTITFQKDYVFETVKFYGDRQQLSQVFLNLLQNSVNALTENAIIEPKIKISVYKEIEKILICIEDNGMGFPKIGREKLTEPYYTTREEGTGLGLAIVEKIVTDHNGQVVFSDSPLLGGAMITLMFEG